MRGLLTILTALIAAGSVLAGPAAAEVRADTFRLLNTATDQCADLSNKSATGREVVQEICADTTTQLWLAQPLSASPLNVQLVNRFTGQCMDLLPGADPGTPVVQAGCSAKPRSQQWQFQFTGIVGQFRIVNQALGQCLEVRDGSLAPGTPIQVSPCLDPADRQVWHRIDVLR